MLYCSLKSCCNEIKNKIFVIAVMSVMSLYLVFILHKNVNKLEISYKNFNTHCFLNLPVRNINFQFDGTVVMNRFKLQPTCNNLLNNVSRGYWKVQEPIDNFEFLLLDNLQTNFQLSLGIPVEKWRSDGKCGYNNHLKNPLFASICNPNGLSCCTDFEDGICVNSSSITCTKHCSRCFDTAKFIYPLLSSWITEDHR